MLPTLFAATIDLQQQAQQQALSGVSQTPNTLIGLILKAVMVIAALAVFILLIWGGLEWITGGGEKAKVESARNKITGAIIGLFVLASVVAIFNLLQQFLGINLMLDNTTQSQQTPTVQTNPNGSHPL